MLFYTSSTPISLKFGTLIVHLDIAAVRLNVRELCLFINFLKRLLRKNEDGVVTLAPCFVEKIRILLGPVVQPELKWGLNKTRFEIRNYCSHLMMEIFSKTVISMLRFFTTFQNCVIFFHSCRDNLTSVLQSYPRKLKLVLCGKTLVKPSSIPVGSPNST